MAQNPYYNKKLPETDISATDNKTTGGIVSDAINFKDIKSSSATTFDIADLDIDDTKQLRKFISRLERDCRISFEYRQFISLLRDSGMNTCSIMKNISNEDSKVIKIHIHHYPLTLFDIAQTILNKHIKEHLSLHEDMICKEIMYNHYKLNVGLISLSETVHEMTHNQYEFIPLWAVLGKWRTFIAEYKQYMTNDTLLNIEKLEDLSKTYDFKKETKILTPGTTKINMDEDEYQATNEQIFNKIKHTLNELKQNTK